MSEEAISGIAEESLGSGIVRVSEAASTSPGRTVVAAFTTIAAFTAVTAFTAAGATAA